jgi:hypothetical protein
MHPKLMLLLLLALALLFSAPSALSDSVGAVPLTETAPNGADLPAAYTTWARVIRRTYTHDTPDGKHLLLLDSWNTWLSIRDRQVYNGETWYRTAGDKWVPAADLQVMPLTPLQGYRFRGDETGQLAYVMLNNTPIYAFPRDSAARVGSLTRYSPLNIQEAQPGWWRIGQDQWISADAARLVKRIARPDGVGEEDKWIDVDLTQQTVAAYEGDHMVYATLMASGKEPTPTITGLYHIYEKKIGEFMAGGWEDKDPYWLEDVPWTMYFTQRYALHGAYWHDEFGAVRSHGCVNLSPADAKWLFTWSGPVVPAGLTRVLASKDNLGTWVYVHN